MIVIQGFALPWSMCRYGTHRTHLRMQEIVLAVHIYSSVSVRNISTILFVFCSRLNITSK